MKLKKRQKLFKKYFKKSYKKENDKVRELIKNDFDQALLRSKEMFQLEEGELIGGPITLWSPDPFYDGDKVKYKVVNKEDNKTELVYDQALLTQLSFSNNTLFYYQVSVDHRTGQLAYDVAGHVNYFDIVHFQTRLDLDEYKGILVSKAFIDLGLSDGSVLELNLRERFVKDGTKEMALLTEDEKKVIDTLSKVVRNSK